MGHSILRPIPRHLSPNSHRCFFHQAKRKYSHTLIAMSHSSIEAVTMSPEATADLVDDAVAWCSQHGLVYGAGLADMPVALVHAPISLLPVAYPAETFQLAKRAATAFNLMIDAVSQDSAYLKRVLEPAARYDEFTVSAQVVKNPLTRCRRAPSITQPFLLHFLAGQTAPSPCRHCGRPSCTLGSRPLPRNQSLRLYAPHAHKHPPASGAQYHRLLFWLPLHPCNQDAPPSPGTFRGYIRHFSAAPFERCHVGHCRCLGRCSGRPWGAWRCHGNGGAAGGAQRL